MHARKLIAGSLSLCAVILAAAVWQASERTIAAELCRDECTFLDRIRRTPSSPRLAPLTTTQFRLHQPIGRLEIERLNLTVPVIEGADDAGLKLGAAHVLGTGYPGAAANCAVAAHRDTLFRPLKNIRPGDVITFRTQTAGFRYQVTGTEIVMPTQTSVLASAGKPEMTLVTCYPFYFSGHAPKRFIVHAKLMSS